MKLRFNTRQRMGGLSMLRRIKPRVARLVIFDPQYRQVADHLAHGNEGQARQGSRFLLPQMNDDLIASFIREIERVLVPSGHLFLWMDKFSLVSGGWHKWMPDISALREVDAIIWDKGKRGMGFRSRRRFEVLVVIQKGPRRAEGIWRDHSIDDVWLEPQPAGHLHAKPEKLTRRLIECVTDPNDIVIDPAAGGFGVLSICRDTGRRFLGCDLSAPGRQDSPAKLVAAPTTSR